MLAIRVDFLKQSQMRYDTCGDWFYEGDQLVIQVSDRLDGAKLDREEQFLIALHELVEAKLCKVHGVSQKLVDDFDRAYRGDGEPGDDPKSPYRLEHRFAMLIEHLMAREMGFNSYGRME